MLKRRIYTHIVDDAREMRSHPARGCTRMFEIEYHGSIQTYKNIRKYEENIV